MYNYATKAYLKKAASVDTSDLANLKSDVENLDIDKFKNAPGGLNNLKSKVDKLDIGKLETSPFDLSKPSVVIKNEVVKKIEYNE